MIETLYIEQAVTGHERTLALRARFPDAKVVTCQHYGEIFNRKSQNFRLQKQRPSLILAQKHNKLVLPIPESYGIGMRHNYYFSHMLNCLYDCRYCFLQGMYRSAHYLLFINYDDFQHAITNTIAQHPDEAVCFFSGYDCDSLALEPLTGFAEAFLPFFAQHPRAYIELRTKSTQIRSLLEREPLDNCVIAFSLSPQEIVQAVEHKTPSLEKRLQAIARLQSHGWRVGLRFDPLIYCQDYERVYAKFFRQCAQGINMDALHSVSLGAFRLPQDYHHKLVQLYPYEPLLAGAQALRQGMVAYPANIEQDLLGFCYQFLLEYLPESRLFSCEAA